jgi:hypothetical protein
MHFVLLFALVGFAAAAVYHGLSVRRGSFLAGLALRPSQADRQVGGWLTSLLLRNPDLCRAMEGLSRVLPGPRTNVGSAFTDETSFTRLQSRTFLHRYFRWQVHNMARVLAALLYCGLVLTVASWGYSSHGQQLVAVGSALLCLWALSSWWNIRTDCEGTRKACRSALGAGDQVVGAFVDLSRGALRQGVAFALVFACNFGFQVLVLVDSDNLLSLNENLERVQRIEETFQEDPTVFAVQS